MKKEINIVGIVFYALIFIIAIPILLWIWAKSTEHLINLPVIQSDIAGWLMIITGGILLLWGWIALMLYGKGLPMNAYPPKVFVRKGLYKLISHPIYYGFGILAAGAFILEGSASGLWLVLPITILGMMAIVLGYEKIDLKERFPDYNYKTILSLPENSNDIASIGKRVLIFLQLIVYIMIVNALIIFAFFIGYDIQVFHQTLIPNLLNITILFLIIMILRSKSEIRETSIRIILALLLYLFVLFMLPERQLQYLYDSDIPTHLNINPYSTMPLFVIFILVNSILRYSKLIIGIISVLTIISIYFLISSAEITFANTLLMALISVLSIYYKNIWELFRALSEKIANSWKEWTFGNVRIINHGFYVGIGSFLGILLSGFLAGDEYAWAILLFCVVVIIFSALWAQIIEGSEKLKRPYGYYGALVGIIFASWAVWLAGYSAWVIIGVVTVVMPWVQAIGRLRCLVNGCCHGKPIESETIGIRYFHHRSRVYNISGLRGELLHPTPLYSILWLTLTGFILLKLWFLNSPIPFIFGMYLILTGIGRFVEEALRGEVQTKIIIGLRLYQWAAVVSVFVGIFFTTVDISPIILNPGFAWQTFIAAVIGGLFTFFAMGVDFPNSNARFSRLV